MNSIYSCVSSLDRQVLTGKVLEEVKTWKEGYLLQAKLIAKPVILIFVSVSACSNDIQIVD